MSERATSAERPRIPLDGAMITALFAVAATGVAMSIVALVAVGWGSALGVGLGALVATANLWAFAIIAQGVLRGGRRARLWGLAGGVKLVALLGAAYLLLDRGLASGLALAIGYGALPIGITVGGLLSPRSEADDEPPSKAGGGRKNPLVTAAPTPSRGSGPHRG